VAKNEEPVEKYEMKNCLFFTTLIKNKESLI